MKFSLVMGTIGRVKEVERFLDSLSRQTCNAFELVLVDQNIDDRLDRAISRVDLSSRIRRIFSPPGLSKARNAGLRHVTGDIIGFPDDDCWYPDTLLQDLTQLFSDLKLSGVTGRSIDERGRPSGGRQDRRSGYIDRSNVWSRGISYTIFLRRSLCNQIGEFDQDLGVGAGTRYGAGEETDYLLRALQCGARINYDANLIVYHPNKDEDFSEQGLARAESYGQGMGRVLAKHSASLQSKATAVLKPIIGATAAYLTGNTSLARLRWMRAMGRFRGMRN